VVFQFSLSILFIIASLGIYKQIRYLKSKDLGYNGKNVIITPLDAQLHQKYDVFRERLLANPDIVCLSRSNATPERKQSSISAGIIRWEGMEEGSRHPYIHLMGADYDFAQTYDIDMAQGRFFSREFKTDWEESVILNEAAVRAMNIPSPVGKKIYWGKKILTIIGIIKDFHYRTLHYSMEPLIIIMPWSLSRISIRLSEKNMPDTLAFIEKTLKDIIPGAMFEYEFFDALLDQEYRAERAMEQLIGYVTFLAVFISCLGLLGLVSFTALQKTKEIGIRKVLGASSSGIIILMSRQLIGWVLLANVFAWPAAYILLKKWLGNFAFRASPGFGLFLFSAACALLIAVLTMAAQALKAARTEIAVSLRYE
jgi:putative ABC transport system permease protein